MAKDDLGAVKILVDALAGFEQADQERIIRWAREKLGLPQSAGTSTGLQLPPITPPGQGLPPPGAGGQQPQDIKTFMTSKNPQSDNHFTAAVAYFYRFVAQGDQRKDSITPNDLQDATRLVNHERFKRPRQTLLNTLNAGLLDKAGHGAYAINAVGENLVAMTLPGGAESRPTGPKKGGTKKGRKKNKTKSRPNR